MPKLFLCTPPTLNSLWETVLWAIWCIIPRLHFCSAHYIRSSNPETSEPRPCSFLLSSSPWSPVPVTKHTTGENTALQSAITVVHVAASDGLQSFHTSTKSSQNSGRGLAGPSLPPLPASGCRLSSKAFHPFPDPKSHAIRFLLSSALKSPSLRLKFTSQMEDLPFSYLGFCILPSDFPPFPTQS